MSTENKFIPAPKTVAIVGCPFGDGQRQAGVEMGPMSIIDKGLVEQLKDLEWAVQFEGHLEFNHLRPTEDPDIGNLKMPRTVSNVNQYVSQVVAGHANAGRIPLTLGGDHSLAMGTISGTLQKYRDLCVVWVDAHGDINTPETTITGNLHGMPVGFLLGLGRSVPEFGWIQNYIQPSQIVYIGLRDLDPGEKRILRELDIKAFTMRDIDERGIVDVVNTALDHVNPGRDRPIHVSFDIDAIDSIVATSTGTSVLGGLHFREGRYICEVIHETGCLVAMDIVEVNPLIEPKYVERTVDAACSLVRSAFGEKQL